jgi:hypothetical protein
MKYCLKCHKRVGEVVGLVFCQNKECSLWGLICAIYLTCVEVDNEGAKP